MRSKLIKTASYVTLGTIISLSAFAGTDPGEMRAPSAHSIYEQEQLQKSSVDVEAQAIDLFSQLDADQNGIVSKAEFLTIGSEQSFDRIDLDTNGQISQVEIFNSMKSQQDS